MSWKGFAINGGAPSRQLRRGIETRLNKLRQKNPKTPRERAEAHKTDTRETCAVDQLRTPSARKPHNGNSDQQPREANTPARLPKKLDNAKQKDKVRDNANAKAFPS